MLSANFINALAFLIFLDKMSCRAASKLEPAYHCGLGALPSQAPIRRSVGRRCWRSLCLIDSCDLIDVFQNRLPTLGDRRERVHGAVQIDVKELLSLVKSSTPPATGVTIVMPALAMRQSIGAAASKSSRNVRIAVRSRT